MTTHEIIKDGKIVWATQRQIAIEEGRNPDIYPREGESPMAYGRRRAEEIITADRKRREDANALNKRLGINVRI